MTDLWDLPFKGDDFDDDERVCSGRVRADELADGGRVHGYELTGLRHGDATRSWTEHAYAHPANTDFHLYAKPVYAMQDGVVVAGWRNAPENPVPLAAGQPAVQHEEMTRYGGGSRIYGGGNCLWVEHPDGTMAEYAHLQPGSVPAELCPHDDVLLPLVESPDLRHAWPHLLVPEGRRAVVRKGQLLGVVGNSGASTRPQLHVHRQRAGKPVPIRFSGGLTADVGSAGWRTRWTSFAGQPIPARRCLVWPPRANAGQHARFGMSEPDFALFHEHLAGSGLWPESLDFYSVAGRVYVNHVWRPARRPWRCYWGADHLALKDIVEQNRTEGFEPVIAEASTIAGAPAYAAVFVAGAPEAMLRHGISYEEHLAVMAEATRKGLAPVSVVVVGGHSGRSYTVLYRKGACANWLVRSHIPEEDYQMVFDEQSAAGRRPAYLSAYTLGGKSFVSAVFASPLGKPRRDGHLLSAARLQVAHNRAVVEGLPIRVLTGLDGARKQHRYAASWWV